MAAQRGMSCITAKLNAAHLSVYTGHSGTRITTSHLLAFRDKKDRAWMQSWDQAHWVSAGDDPSSPASYRGIQSRDKQGYSARLPF